MGRRRRWSRWGSIEREEGWSDPPKGGGGVECGPNDVEEVVQVE